MRKIVLLPLVLLMSGISISYAQEGATTAVTTAKKNEKTDIEILSFLRGFTIGGLVQAQWQLGQEKGMNGGPASGGAFSPNTDNRFMLRRGYLKMGYDSKYFSSLVQINATAEGISLVNAYAQINTASKSAGLRVGNIYKQFGYFISYSSGARLTPEISRGEQSLFTDATAPGARIMLRDTRDTWARYFTMDLSYFTGSGLKDDYYASRDFIGKLEYVRGVGDFTLGGQFSTLIGSLSNSADESFSFTDNRLIKENSVEGKRASRAYFSIGATVGLKSILGDTKLIGEYIFGNQLGLENDNTTPSKKLSKSTAPLFDRDFSNYYIFLQHQIVKTNFTFIARYDFMNPNTSISKDEIGVTEGSNAADVSYSTIGFGVYYKFLKYMSASVYYDIVSNEKCKNLAGYDKNRKDNLFTLRLQCLF